MYIKTPRDRTRREEGTQPNLGILSIKVSLRVCVCVCVCVCVRAAAPQRVHALSREERILSPPPLSKTRPVQMKSVPTPSVRGTGRPVQEEEGVCAAVINHWISQDPIALSPKR